MPTSVALPYSHVLMDRDPDARRPQRKWGQNFLRNDSAAQKIAASLEPLPGELIVEIGPGDGALTRRLATLGPLQVIEIDPGLAARLREQFGERITVVDGDALQVPLPQTPFCAVGNLPYNAGTPILRRVIAAAGCRRSVFMLQKEVADRLVARAGDEAYGYLTLYAQLYADATILMTLAPGSFRPSPKVWSSVVILDRVVRVTSVEKEILLRVISAAFAMRRKQLRNNLAAAFNLEKRFLDTALTSIGLPADIRAERMSLEDFDRLSALIVPLGDDLTTRAHSSPRS
ncbi:MAG TPA: 16S rRNA (adenine(1518)-N(6)/adenine(1519)-N(6))-dimethyltransferase RsmA [Thermoanaerobaculia bacterium]|nr:16S rRNA (adenine(1518)-N(6)/adenine(1519)-N(6))-dimethyltransferase RsmA [Thermoanaerobaculia bacterium]